MFLPKTKLYKAIEHIMMLEFILLNICNEYSVNPW